MFLVARPQHSHQPMFATADTFHPRYESIYPAFYDEDQAYLEAQYVARQRDEAVRQRARAAALRAQQRREYERQLVIRAAEEEAYARYVAHARGREAAIRQAEAYRQAQEEQQRLVAAARRDQALKAVTFQRMVRCHHIFPAIRLLIRPTQIHALLIDALAHKTDEDAKLQPAPAPIAESQSPEPVIQKPIYELLCERASTETDPELLVTLNGLLQTLLPPSATSPSTSSSTAPVPAASSAETSAPASPATPAPAPTATFTRKPSLEILDRLSTTFAHLTSAFTLPAVDFSRPSTPGRSSSPTTHLSFTTANRPIHEYEAALSKLLTELDAVDSDGDDSVRTRRRELVKSVEAALADLDAAIAAQRREHDQDLQEPSVEHTVAAVFADDVQGHDMATSTETAVPTSTIEIVAPIPVHASQAPSSPDAALLATAPIDDANTSPEDTIHIVADTDAADVDTASPIVEQDAADIPPTVDTVPADLDTPSTGEVDIATAPATSTLSDHATHDTAAEPAPVAPSPIMAPLSSMDIKTNCDGEEHAQPDTPSPSLRATSSDPKTIGTDLGEEAVLLDGINSEDDRSEADA
jgi:hypothetical protein